MYAGAINNPESLSMEVGAANTEADVPATGPASARSRATSIAESVYTAMSHEAEVRDRFRMNDQQWVLQRKKIGLSRRNKRALHTRLVEERQKMSAITYIHTHFNRKECTKFVPTNGQLCSCGWSRAEHKTAQELEAENDELFGTKYIRDRDVDKVSEASENVLEVSVTDSLADLLRTPEKAPSAYYKENKKKALKDTQEFSTNAYGRIEFEGMHASKLAKYLRLADNSTMASVKEFLCDYWHLTSPRPHLALSIVGGAKNFKLDGRKKETFKRGLIAAGQATNAWVLTG